jgi:hypothetical protein
MFKIGTGEAGTIAGRVYLTASIPEKEGDCTWVHCQGKLWARRVNEGADLGHLLVFDPQTFKLEGTAKIILTPPQSNSAVNLPEDPASLAKHSALINSLNKFYPLLTDGQNLFALTMNIVTKRRRVKDSMRKHYQLYQEEKKK